MRMMKREPDTNPNLQPPRTPAHVTVPKACCHMYEKCGEHGVSQVTHVQQVIEPVRDKMPKARKIDVNIPD